MSRKHFGTDGVRGVANRNLTPELALSLGQAAGRFLLESGRRPRIVQGRDTRQSGTMLGAALAAGFNSVGIEVLTLGVAPTPTVASVARRGDYGLGAIISASHNPAPDNGIKFVGHDGKKLSDAEELRIESLMEEPVARPIGAAVGQIISDRSEIEGYMDALAAIVPEGLAGLRIAVDGANGAAYELGPQILERLGATVVTIGDEPNGANINEHCGATMPTVVQELTVRERCAIGVAFDGDADRAVFSDEKGRLINGDRMMGIWAGHRKQLGLLEPPVVVGTVMSNGGFERYLSTLGITLERTQVGDKYVSERISATGAHIGGEQSGHIVFPEHGPTGDGLATMLELFKVLKTSGMLASELYESYEALPQVLVNVEVADRSAWKTALVEQTLSDTERELGTRGRISIRASGTQPVVRIMVESDDKAMRDQIAEKLLTVLASEASAVEKSRVDLTNGLGD